MAESLQKKSLLIVSDTAMVKTSEGVQVFEPALREIESLDGLFSHITWIGFDYSAIAELPMRLAQPGLIHFVVLPKATGGVSILSKFKILPYLPYLYAVIFRNIVKHNVIHTRGPSIPAMFVAMISLADRSRLYWHKYAGNWMQGRPPWAYALNRRLLKWNVKSIITINGLWKNQENHIISFANPCLTREELEAGKNSFTLKSYDNELTIIFVGNLIPSKGLGKLLEALKMIDSRSIKELIVAGDGPNRKDLENRARKLDIEVVFYGAIPRSRLEEYYKVSHILVLLSDSEGFPKVIAEAAAFGCIPFALNVSSISQYVQHNLSGVLLDRNSTLSEISNALQKLMKDRKKLASMAMNAVKLSEAFTYDIYRLRVQNEILSRA
jgi:glycosyltransferase involved in cell wall biosynthesis